jgi:hypothetical protein
MARRNEYPADQAIRDAWCRGAAAVRAIDRVKDDARWMIWREESYHYARTEARLAVRSALAAVGIKGAL